MNDRARLHLDPPRRVAAGALAVRGRPREREAVRVRLHDGQGRVGLGETMPLPGYSRGTAAGAAAVLTQVAAAVSSDGWVVTGSMAAGASSTVSVLGAPTSPADLLDAALAPWDRLLAASPGARFALECALVDLLARRAGVSAAQWLAAGRALQPVPVSLLLPDDDGDVPAAARAAVADGFTVLKLKVARHDRPAVLEDALLAELRRGIDATGPGVRLRLDANGKLDAGQVVARMAAWRAHGIELVEEPLAGAALLAMPPLPLPWAADESLADPALAAALMDLPPARRPAALVLKPAELGLTRCLRLAADAARHGVGVIVTHSLDGDLGHAAACALAAALPAPPWPCGLAPHAGLWRPPAATPWMPLPTAPGLGVPDDGDDADASAPSKA